MANLYNKKTRRLEQGIPDDEVNQKILSNEYEFSFEPNEKVFLKDSNGSPVSVRASKAANYIRQGQATFATALEVQQFEENKAFAQSGLGALSATALGLDDWLAGGLGSAVAESLGIFDEGMVEAVQSENPFQWNALGAPAALIGGYLSAGAATGARAAARGAAAAVRSGVKESSESIAKNNFNKLGTWLSDYTLPGVAAKIGAKVQKGSAEAFARVGGRYVPYRIGNSELAKRFGPATAKIMGASTGALVEGGLWGAGEGISEAVVGEPEEAAEHILNSIGTNALIGGAFGGAVSTAVPMLVGAKGIAANVADKILDVTGAGGEAILNKSRKQIIRIAKNTHNLSDAAANRLADILSPGLTGEESFQQMQNLIRNVDAYSADIARFVDATLLTDDFLQMADQNGFSKDFLKKQIRLTRQSREFAGDPIDDLEVRAIKKEGAKLNELLERLESDITKYPYPKYLELRTRIMSEIEENNRKLGTTKYKLQYEESSIPDTSSEVIENVKNPYNRARQDLLELARNNPEIDANNEISRLIHELNVDEIKLYSPLFSDESLKTIEANRIANQPSQLELLRAEKLNKKNRRKVDNWFSFFKSKLEDNNIEAYADIFNKKARGKRSNGEPTADVDIGQLKHALKNAAETGDITDLIDLGKLFDVSPRMLVKGSGSTWKTMEPIITSVRSLDIETDEIGGEIWKNQFLENQKRFNDFTNLLSDSDLSEIKKFVNNKNLGPMNGYLDKPSSTKKPPPDGYTSIQQEYFTYRELLERDMERLGNLDIFLDDVIVNAWKNMENLSTRLLKESQSGFIGTSDKAQSVVESTIEQLRNALKDTSKFGELAVQKDIFDRAMFDFSKLREQALVDFTSGLGADQVADSKKILSYIREADKHTSDITTNRILAYSKNGRNLLKELSQKFEPVDIADVPDSIRIRVNKKLQNAGSLPLGQAKLDADTRLGWGARVNDVDKFLARVQDELENRVNYLRDELPLANLLMGEQARSGNVNQTLRELGRGGFVGAGTYALTGSPQIAMAGGAIAGAAGMAQNPRQLIGLINQLKSIHKSSREAVKEYIEAWEKNVIPESAKARGWENQSRQAFLVAAKAFGDDKRESRTEIRRKEIERKANASLNERLEIAIGRELTEDNFFELRDSLTQLVKSPLVLERFLEEVTRPFSGTPAVQKAMKAAIRNHIKIAARTIPRTTSSSAFGQEYPPTPVQLQAFNRALQILTDPSETILASMLSGTLTVDMMDILREAWPNIYQDMLESTFEILNDPQRVQALSQKQKQTLSVMMGVPFSNPQEFQRLQQNFAGEEQGGAPARGPRGTGVTAPSQASGIGTTTSIVERPR